MIKDLYSICEASNLLIAIVAKLSAPLFLSESISAFILFRLSVLETYPKIKFFKEVFPGVFICCPSMSSLLASASNFISD